MWKAATGFLCTVCVYLPETLDGPFWLQNVCMRDNNIPPATHLESSDITIKRKKKKPLGSSGNLWKLMTFAPKSKNKTSQCISVLHVQVT